jgi:hypothetical protein
MANEMLWLGDEMLRFGQSVAPYLCLLLFSSSDGRNEILASERDFFPSLLCCELECY